MLFLGVHVKVFPNEITTWLGGPGKGDHPPEGGGHYLNQWGAEENKKAEEGGIRPFGFLPARLSWDISPLLPLDWESQPPLLWFFGLQTQTELHHCPSWVSSFQNQTVGLTP